MKRKSSMPKHKLEQAATGDGTGEQPAPKRLRPPLNFSIESIMQPAAAGQERRSRQQMPSSPESSPAGSPLGMSHSTLAACPPSREIQRISQFQQQRSSRANGLTGEAGSRSPSRSPSSRSEASSNDGSEASQRHRLLNAAAVAAAAATGTSNNNSHHHHHHHQQHRRHHRHQHNHDQQVDSPSSASSPQSSEATSALSSRNSSRVSSPISPGCNTQNHPQQHQHSHQHNHLQHQQLSHQQHQNQHQQHSHNFAQQASAGGLQLDGFQQHHTYRPTDLHASASSPPFGVSRHPQNHHPQHHHQHQHQPHSNQQAGTSSSSPSSMGLKGGPQVAGGRTQATAVPSATAIAAATTTSSTNATNGGSNCHLDQVECILDNKEMWDKFHALNTEMIITKTGRRMFPVLKVQFNNLDPSARYAVSMDIVPVDNKRYRYAYHKSCWQVAGKADPSAEPRLYPHPDSPFNGDLLSRQVISFEKVKLTNNEMDKSGHIILNSMHKYQPRVHLIELRSTIPQQSAQQQQQQQSPLQQIPLTLNGKMSSSAARYQQQQQQLQQRNSCRPQPQLDIEGYRTFVFPETVFTAVTAYQNQLITKMKIDKNPFAKGFRDSSRLSDLDRNDPYDYISSLGPAAAAAAAAAAACAAGRFPGAGPPPTSVSGPGGVGGLGGGPPLPPGTLEALASAAGMSPNQHQGQMDQAYAQLVASAAASANSPWYSAAAAAAAAAANPFGAACSTAQAAQQLQTTHMWLALSALMNGGPAGSAGHQLAGPGSLAQPSGAGPMSSLETPGPPSSMQMDSSAQLQQECRGDSRGSG